MELQKGYEMLVSLEVIKKLNPIHNHLYIIWYFQNISLNQKKRNFFDSYTVNSYSHDCRILSILNNQLILKNVDNYDNFNRHNLKERKKETIQFNLE